MILLFYVWIAANIFLQIFEVTVDVKIVWEITKLVKPTLIIT